MLTWLFAGLTGVAYVIVMGVLLVSKDRLVELIETDEQFQRLDIATNDLVGALWVVSAVLIVWCLAAMVLAFLAFRRHNWARITLVVSAAMSLLLGLAAFPFSLLHLLAAGAVIVLLFVGDSNRWFSGAGRSGGYSGPPAQGTYGGPPPERQDPPGNVW